MLENLYQAKYGWTEQEMSTYLFDYRLGYMLSLWILVPIMTNWLSLSDNMIAIIACLLSAAGRREILQRPPLSLDQILPTAMSLCKPPGFILPAVTGPEVWLEVRNDFLGHLVLNWFSVGSFLCLLAPVTTITTRSTISQYLHIRFMFHVPMIISRM